MALTEAQLERRQTALGSSDIPAIVGLNPFRTPFDVWLSKRTASRGPVATVSDAGSSRTRMGDLLEPTILTFYVKEFMPKHYVALKGQTVEGPLPWMVATPDMFVAKSESTHIVDRIVEAKAVGSRMRRHWYPEDGGDDYGRAELIVPTYVQAQVQWQLGVCGVNHGDVIAYFGGTDEPQLAPLPFDEEAYGMIRELAERFWIDHILGDTPPPAQLSESLSDRARKLFPTVRESDVLIVPEDPRLSQMVADYLDAKRLKEQGDKLCDDALGRLLAEVGDHEGIANAHIGTLTWKLRRGNPSYRELAEALYREWVADEPLPADLVDQFRSPMTRVANTRGLKDPREGGKP